MPKNFETKPLWIIAGICRGVIEVRPVKMELQTRHAV